MKAISFEDMNPDGLLKDRAELAFDHLQGTYFQWDSISHVNFEAFPGDAVGRCINGLALLSQALHQPAPANLQEIVRRCPELANSDGYLGPKLPESRANEDVMAGHNGYACGLTEYALWTKNPQTAASLKQVVSNLFVPVRSAIACYREDSDAAAKMNWHFSGGDIGQLFLCMDGMTRAYALAPTPQLKATIETAIDRYRKLDLVAISAHMHSTLTAATGILRWYEMQRRPEDLAFAEKLYKQYRDLAMTETYENFNWFNKPQWTEACAVIDSYILTVNLWRITGRANYLEDAHLILFNGVLPGQLRNGGFGTSPCVGPATGVSRAKEHNEAPFCCSMRGGEGLARAIEYCYFLNNDTVILPFYSDSTATLRFPDGSCKVSQKTAYPYKGEVRLEVMESQVTKEKELRLFVPSRVVQNSLKISVNGTNVKSRLVDSFAVMAVKLEVGTVIEVAFQQERGPRAALHPDKAPGACRYFNGPLLLGSATENGDEPLTPILDVFAPRGKDAAHSVQGWHEPSREFTADASGGQPYVYFPKRGSQPVAKAVSATTNPNLAEKPQVFRGNDATEKLPREAGEVFSEFKHLRDSIFCIYVWSRPQEARQMLLQWPESAAMPKPQDVTLHWSDAGVLHAVEQPGIIGNGRQWVYKLGTPSNSAHIIHLVLTVRTTGISLDTLDTFGTPEVEVHPK